MILDHPADRPVEISKPRASGDDPEEVIALLEEAG